MLFALSSSSIAAASILAKVTRDRICFEDDKEYPEYQFAKHKGYSTALHMEILRKIGPSPIHRRSFLKFLDE
jgi:ribonuclease HII